MGAVHHPIDFEALRKGDVIGQAQIEEISQVKYSEDPEQYRIEQMKLRGQIEDHRPDLYPIMTKRVVRVLTDTEAVNHRESRQVKDTRSMRRNASRGSRIDRTQLSQVENRRADYLDQHIGMAAIEADRLLRESRKKIRSLDSGPPTAPRLEAAEKTED